MFKKFTYLNDQMIIKFHHWARGSFSFYKQHIKRMSQMQFQSQEWLCWNVKHHHPFHIVLWEEENALSRKFQTRWEKSKKRN